MFDFLGQKKSNKCFFLKIFFTKRTHLSDITLYVLKTFFFFFLRSLTQFQIDSLILLNILSFQAQTLP